MKVNRKLSLILSIMMLLNLFLPISMTAEERTPFLSVSRNMKTAGENTEAGTGTSGQQVGIWGTFGGTEMIYEPGRAEDGIGSALHITGGAGGGGGQLALNDSGFSSNTVTHKDASGATIGKTKGFIDASELVIRVKSTKGFSVKFLTEYRVAPTRTLSSKGVSVPSTNGEWADITIPLSAFEPDEDGEWIYNMWGRYTSNFDPVVLLKLESVNFGESSYATIGELRMNWYQEDMVAQASISGQKTSYYQYYDSFDYSAGTISITRGDGSTEQLALTDSRVTVAGYNNTVIKNDPTDSKNLKITVTVLNVPIVYYVRIIPFAPPNLTEIAVQAPKVAYKVNDPFDFTIGQIIATYSDKPQEEAALNDPNTKVTGFNSSQAVSGQVITVTYGGKSTTYTIDITDFTIPNLTSIQVQDARRLYKIGDTFDWHTGKIVPMISGSPGTSVKLYNRYATIEGFDSTTAVSGQVITVTYAGMSTTYTIDVINSDLPAAYTLEQTMQPGSRPDSWGGWSGFTLGYQDGIAEDGTSSALYITGATSGGGGMLALAGSDFAAGNVTQSDGTILQGFVGADALKFRYKSTKNLNVRFRIEYRASGSPTKSSKAYTLLNTNDEWTDAIIPFKNLEPDVSAGDTFEAQRASVDWVHNIKGGYTTNFEPVVLLRFEGSLGTNHVTIGNIKALWYEQKPVQSIYVSGVKTNYFIDDEINLSQGQIHINHKDGTSKTVKLDSTNVSVTGFDSSEIVSGQEITVSYAGVTTTYQVNVTEPIIYPAPTYLAQRFENLAGTTINYFSGQVDVVAKIVVGNEDPVIKQTSGVLLAAAYIGDKLAFIKEIEKKDIPQGVTFLTTTFTTQELVGITKLKIITLKDAQTIEPIFSQAAQITKVN